MADLLVRVRVVLVAAVAVKQLVVQWGGLMFTRAIRSS